MAILFLIEYFQEFLDQNKPQIFEKYPGLTARQLLYAYEDYANDQCVVLSKDDFASEKNISNRKMKLFLELVLQGIPLNYISKQRYFMNLALYVDHRVLVPRNETEVLVDDLAKKNKKAWAEY